MNALKLSTQPLNPQDEPLIGEIAATRAWSCRNHECSFRGNICGQGCAFGRQDLLVCLPVG